jgi:hypothetical protein
MTRLFIKYQSILPLLPVILALVLFPVLTLDCSAGRGPGMVEITVLYTSDAGGAIDPCG